MNQSKNKVMNNEIIIEKLLDLIFTSIISEGGDGDAIWLLKQIDIDILIPIIDEFNQKNNTNWIIETKDGYLFWGYGMEGAIITNNENLFNSFPNYITLKIIY